MFVLIGIPEAGRWEVLRWTIKGRTVMVYGGREAADVATRPNFSTAQAMLLRWWRGVRGGPS